jgi:hypothetical protein
LDEERSLRKRCGYMTRTALLLLYAAAPIKTHEAHSGEQRPIFAARVLKYIEVDGGIFEHLL